MVKGQAILALDAACGTIAALLHPSTSRHARAALIIYMCFCLFVRRPFLRYGFLILGTAGLRLLAYFGLAAAFYPETAYFPFFLAGIVWSLVPSGFAGQKTGPASLVGMGAVAFAGAALGFLILAGIDRVVPRVAPLFLVATGTEFSRIHLAGAGAIATAAFLVVWSLAVTAARRGREKIMMYADGYLACRRDLKRLSRKWVC